MLLLEADFEDQNLIQPCEHGILGSKLCCRFGGAPAVLPDVNTLRLRSDQQASKLISIFKKQTKHLLKDGIASTPLLHLVQGSNSKHNRFVLPTLAPHRGDIASPNLSEDCASLHAVTARYGSIAVFRVRFARSDAFGPAWPLFGSTQHARTGSHKGGAIHGGLGCP